MLLMWLALSASFAAMAGLVARPPKAIPVRVRNRRTVRVVRRD